MSDYSPALGNRVRVLRRRSFDLYPKDSDRSDTCCQPSAAHAARIVALTVLATGSKPLFPNRRVEPQE